MRTIPALLSQAACRWGDKPALVDDGRKISFARLEVEADRVARGFLALGAKKGDRIVIWAPNRWEWVAAAVGLQRIGAVLVPLNTRLRGPEVAGVMRRAGVRFVVCVGTFLGQYYPDLLKAEDLPALERIIVLRDDPPVGGLGQMGWSDFLADGSAIAQAEVARRAESLRPEDISDIMFTSGTTGQPKGAVFSHERSILGGVVWEAVSGLNETDHFCVFGPFSHNASYKAGWITGLLTGATVYWPESYAPETIYRLISDFGITVLPAPPTVFQELYAHPDFPTWRFSSLRYVSTGGTRVPMSLLRKLRDEFHIPAVTVGYGMTECCGSATQTRSGDELEMLATTDGRPVPGTEIRIVDEQGGEVPAGQPGEVLIRCKQVLIEYLDDPQATAAALDADGWLHSGDIGVLNERGYLKITDRLKDMYIVGGFNVYPAEIERQMSSLEGVVDCAVVGVPDERLGEVGRAFVVKTAGSPLTETDVIAWSRENLASYKAPRTVRFVDSLPRNASGKVIKYQLRLMGS